MAFSGLEPGVTATETRSLILQAKSRQSPSWLCCEPHVRDPGPRLGRGESRTLGGTCLAIRAAPGLWRELTDVSSIMGRPLPVNPLHDQDSMIKRAPRSRRFFPNFPRVAASSPTSGSHWIVDNGRLCYSCWLSPDPTGKRLRSRPRSHEFSIYGLHRDITARYGLVCLLRDPCGAHQLHSSSGT